MHLGQEGRAGTEGKATVLDWTIQV